MATTTYSNWLTSTEQEYYEHPARPMAAPGYMVVVDTVPVMDTTGDEHHILQVPSGCKISAMYFEHADPGTASDTDILLRTTVGTTDTDVSLKADLGDAANTGEWIFPATDQPYIAQVAESNLGYGVILLDQTGGTTTSAYLFKMIVFYR